MPGRTQDHLIAGRSSQTQEQHRYLSQAKWIERRPGKDSETPADVHLDFGLDCCLLLSIFSTFPESVAAPQAAEDLVKTFFASWRTLSTRPRRTTAR